MKRIYVLFTALCVCCALAAQDIKELLILHTNDTHSRVELSPLLTRIRSLQEKRVLYVVLP